MPKGDRPMKTLYDIKFKVEKPWTSLCRKHLEEEDVAKFRQAIVDDYYFEMMLDELPIWGYVGELDQRGTALTPRDLLRQLKGASAHHTVHDPHGNSTRYFLFTHLDFSLAYNGQHVIEVNVSADPLQRVDLASPGARDVEFSYAVRWAASDVPFAERMSRYAQYSFLPQSFEIHWLSIINSFVLVLLLTAFLTIILMRVLKNDFSRYASAADDEDEDEEETGWKLVHGDVFRLPPAFGLLRLRRDGRAALLAHLLPARPRDHEHVLPGQPRRHVHDRDRPLRPHRRHRRLRLRAHVLPLLRRRRPVGVEPRALGDALPAAVPRHVLLPQHGRHRLQLAGRPPSAPSSSSASSGPSSRCRSRSSAASSGATPPRAGRSRCQCA